MKFSGFLIALPILLSLGVINEISAQIQQPYRFEEELKNSEEGFSIISLKSEGLALVRELDRFTLGKKKWQIQIVDTTLTRVWADEMELENRLALVGYEYNSGQLFLLFREGESDRNGFQLKTIQLQNREIKTDKIKFEMDFRISHFTIAGGSAVFGGYINNESAVLLYNQSSEQPKVLPGLFMSDIQILDIRTNQNQSFNVLLLEGKGREMKKLVLRTYDHDGNLIIDDIIDVDPKYTMLNGLTSTLEQEEMIIVGTYGEGNQRQALGIYSVVVDPFNEQAITYTDFSTFRHFLDRLSPRKAEKIRAKANKEKTTGNIADFKAYVAPLRIEERNDGFYLLAEMYMPTHNSSPYPYNSFYNPYSYGSYPYGVNPYMNRYYSPYSPYTPYPSSYSRGLDSDYRMLQSMVVKLNTRGVVEKDISLKLNDLRQSGLDQVSDFIVDKDSTLLLFKDENKIYYVKSSGTTDEKSEINQSKVELKNKDETIKDENRSEGVTRFWYDRNFYLWGHQTIVGEKEKRQVFYINRIRIE